VKGQHSLKRGTSESVLGKWKKKPFEHSSALNSSKFRGSVGSLPSLVLNDDHTVDKGESWVTSEQFKEILETKEKEMSKGNLERLEDENAELRKQLEFAGRRSSSVSLLGKSKFQELERDVTKLQAKICNVPTRLCSLCAVVNIDPLYFRWNNQARTLALPGGWSHFLRPSSHNFQLNVQEIIVMTVGWTGQSPTDQALVATDTVCRVTDLVLIVMSVAGLAWSVTEQLVGRSWPDQCQVGLIVV
jgi:hypothetical protein